MCPIYEYKCKECGKISDDFSRTNNIKESMTCRFCGGIATKIMSAVGGIKMGDLVMSVIKKGNPNESADENFYRCLQVAEAKDQLPKLDSPMEKAKVKEVVKKAKEKGW